MNWYKKAQEFKVSPNTIMHVDIPITIGEFLKLDEWFDYGKNSKTVKEIILKIIRQHPELIRMHTEGKI